MSKQRYPLKILVACFDRWCGANVVMPLPAGVSLLPVG